MAGRRMKPDYKEVNWILWVPVWAIGRSSTWSQPAQKGPLTAGWRMDHVRFSKTMASRSNWKTSWSMLSLETEQKAELLGPKGDREQKSRGT